MKFLIRKTISKAPSSSGALLARIDKAVAAERSVESDRADRLPARES